jgi:hypothetical protein
MPLFFYLPAIIWMGMIAAAFDATRDDLDERNDAQRISDPADLTVMDESVIRFRLPLAR